METLNLAQLRNRRLSQGSKFVDFSTGQRVVLDQPLRFSGKAESPDVIPSTFPTEGLKTGENQYVLEAAGSHYSIALWTLTGTFEKSPTDKTSYEDGAVSSGKPFMPGSRTTEAPPPVVPSDSVEVEVDPMDFKGALVSGTFQDRPGGFLSKMTKYKPVRVVEVEKVGEDYRITTDNTKKPDFLLSSFSGHFSVSDGSFAIPRVFTVVRGKTYSDRKSLQSVYKEHQGTLAFSRDGRVDHETKDQEYQGYSLKKQNVGKGVIEDYVWWGPHPGKDGQPKVVGTGVTVEKQRWSPEAVDKFGNPKPSFQKFPLEREHRVYSGNPDHDEVLGLGPWDKERDLDFSSFTGTVSKDGKTTMYRSGQETSIADPEDWAKRVWEDYLLKKEEVLAKHIKKSNDRHAEISGEAPAQAVRRPSLLGTKKASLVIPFRKIR